jgi:hypothetical protein
MGPIPAVWGEIGVRYTTRIGIHVPWFSGAMHILSRDGIGRTQYVDQVSGPSEVDSLRCRIVPTSLDDHGCLVGARLGEDALVAGQCGV